MQHRSVVVLAFLILSLVTIGTLQAKPTDPVPKGKVPFIQEAQVDFDVAVECPDSGTIASDTLTITGIGLGLSDGPSPVINLGTYPPLTVCVFDEELVVADLPTGTEDGDYLLSVITADGVGTFDLTIGAVGPAGADGADGANGEDGIDGVVGAQGPQGIQGKQGPQGEQGLQGESGPEGPQGPAGAIGPEGPEGPEGLEGPAGATGDKGDPGTAADAIAAICAALGQPAGCDLRKAISCGDSVVNFDEGCDDGNSINGDGCSAGCVIEDLGAQYAAMSDEDLFAAALSTLIGSPDCPEGYCLCGIFPATGAACTLYVKYTDDPDNPTKYGWNANYPAVMQTGCVAGGVPATAASMLRDMFARGLCF